MGGSFNTSKEVKNGDISLKAPLHPEAFGQIALQPHQNDAEFRIAN